METLPALWTLLAPDWDVARKFADIHGPGWHAISRAPLTSSGPTWEAVGELPRLSKA